MKRPVVRDGLHGDGLRGVRPEDHLVTGVLHGQGDLFHGCHILPPSEIDLGLCLAVFAGSGGK